MFPADRWPEAIRALARLSFKSPTPEFCRELARCLQALGLPRVALVLQRSGAVVTGAGADVPLGAEEGAEILFLAASGAPLRLETGEGWPAWPGVGAWRQAGVQRLLGLRLELEGEAEGRLLLGLGPAGQGDEAGTADILAGQVALAVRLHLAEMRVRDSEATYKAVFDNAMDAIFLASPDGSIDTANPAACRLLGRSPGEWAHLRREDVVDRNDPRLSQALAERERTGGFLGELNFRHAGGAIVPVELSSTLFPGADGRPRTLIIARDTARRRAVEEALRSQETILRSFFDSAPFMMGLVDVQGSDIRHLADNEACARFFGLTPGDMRGRLASELAVPPQGISVWVGHYNRSRQEGRPVQFDYEHALPGGSCWLSVTVNYVGPGEPGCHRYSYVVEDVSYRKAAEAEAGRLGSMYLALSETNRVVALRSERDTLLRDVCTIATVCNGFAAAAIALVDPATGKAELVACKGSPEAREIVERHHADAQASGPEADRWRALDQGRHFVCDDWCTGENTPNPLRSLAAFPVVVDGRLEAVFNVYSHSPGAFDLRTVAALNEMAAALSLGLGNLAREERRRAAEEALRRSEEDLRRLIHSSQEGIWTADVEGRTIYMNPRMAELLGYSPDEVVGQSVFSFMDEYWAASGRENFRHCLAGASEVYDFCLRRRGGSPLWAIVSTSPLRSGPEGRVVGMQAMVTDITARKFAEEALKESEGRFRAITDAAGDAVVVVDGRGAISFWNAAAERIFGFSAGEVLGQDLHVLVASPEDRRAAQAGMAAFRRDGVGAIFETTREAMAVRKGGQLFPVELSVSPFWTRGGWNAVGIVRDISRRKRDEAALRESQALLSRVMDLVPVAIYLRETEPDRIVFVNRAVERMTGHSREQIMAMGTEQVRSLVHPDDAAALSAVLAKRQPGLDGEVAEYDCRLATQEGGWRHINLREVEIERVEGQARQILGVARDMTARVWQQLAEEQKLADFAHMGRLVTMGEMASAMAHELNQPLTAIANFTRACLNFLRRGQVDLGELEEGLEKALAQSLRAGAVLNTVREFVRKRESNPARLDINQTIEDVVGLARIRSRNRPVEYSLFLQPGLPLVWADSILIEQVLMNLLRNAEEAVAEGAGQTIEISTDLGEEGFVLVSVYDSGLGLPPGFDLEKLPPFFTTKESGMGIGLGICRSIVEAGGGRIWAESPAGGGTTFRFTLPADHV